tara:strand:- start:490 stop:966 length:477 start_codon:yes stop_codon:yes gene_type:complete
MNHFLSDLHPNPGWRKNEQSSKHISPIIGKHCILELYECDKTKLNDEAFIRTIMTASARVAEATLINLITHSFLPQGVTGLALLAESHISIHTWPEIGYAAVDVFTCGANTFPERACEVFVKELVADSYLLKNLSRETPKKISSVLREAYKANLEQIN